MSIQTKAGFLKEALSFFRTSKFIIIAVVLLGLSALSPLLITGLGDLMDSMSDIYDEMGMDVSGMTGMLSAESALGVSTTVSDLTTTGLIIYLLLINRAAGGEQKKRDVIIPQTAGLRSTGYLFPKYIVYPLSAFVLSVLGMFVSWGVSSVAFEINNVNATQVLIAGILVGMCMMFYVCFHITLGTATGKPGLSAAVCIVASVLLPSIFVIVGTDYLFNPFALNTMATDIIVNLEISGELMRDIAATIAFALGLMVLSYFIALFAQNAKKIDNSGDEIEL